MALVVSKFELVKSHRGRIVPMIKLQTDDCFVQLLFRLKKPPKHWKKKAMKVTERKTFGDQRGKRLLFWEAATILP